MSNASGGDLAVFFLAQGEQQPDVVMADLTAFIGGAQQSLDIAAYDMRFSGRLKAQLVAALQERAAAGVRIRICYDADKPEPPSLEGGQDPAPAGTGAFVQALGYEWRRIGGMKLMHNKYIVRDGTAVWAGSTNFTDDAFSLMENNIVTISSPALAGYYAQDFADLWQKGHIENTGNITTHAVPIAYAGTPATVQVMFSPGCGLEIDYEIARRVGLAQRRVRICSMLLNSGALLSALNDLLRYNQSEVSGIYDRTQMASVLQQWQDVPHNHWKIGAVQDVIAYARLVGKDSTPYGPDTPHDFMHNKILIVDDTVITGSYNFSRSAQFNAENIVFIESAALADRYSAYITHLMQKYGG